MVFMVWIGRIRDTNMKISKLSRRSYYRSCRHLIIIVDQLDTFIGEDTGGGKFEF
jgi:hypothetical protein